MNNLPPKAKRQRNSDSTTYPDTAPPLPARTTHKRLRTVPNTQHSVALSSGPAVSNRIKTKEEKAMKEEAPKPILMSPFKDSGDSADLSASSAVPPRRSTRLSTGNGYANACLVSVRTLGNATPGPSGSQATPDEPATEEPMSSLKKPVSRPKTPFLAPRIVDDTSSTNDSEVSMPPPTQPPVPRSIPNGRSDIALPTTPPNRCAIRIDSPDLPMAPPQSPVNLPLFEVKINLDIMGHSISGTHDVNLTEQEIERISSLWGVDKQIALLRLTLQDLIELKLRNIVTDVAISTTLFERFVVHLADYHLPRDDTVAMMKFTECLLSGSIVLAIMFLGRFTLGDIDIYVSKTYQHALIHFLWKQGYRGGNSIYVDRPGKDNYLGSVAGVYAIYELTHPASNKKVNVVVLVGKAILPILLFHSTLVMNYIAYHGIVLLNGRMTLQGVGVSNYLPEKVTDRVKICFDKYTKRGFRIWHWNRNVHTCGSTAGCPQTLRCLFDKHVEHFLFPGQLHGMKTTHRLNEGSLVKWRSASGPACMSLTDDKHGFVACDDFYHSTVKDETFKGILSKQT